MSRAKDDYHFKREVKFYVCTDPYPNPVRCTVLQLVHVIRPTRPEIAEMKRKLVFSHFSTYTLHNVMY